MPSPWSRSATCRATCRQSSAGWRRSRRCLPSSATSPWSIHRSPQGRGEGDQRARKRLVLWLKENRQRFVEHCRGILLSANGQPDNLADLQQLAPVLQAVYGPPVSVAPDLASARGMAKALLSEAAKGMNW